MTDALQSRNFSLVLSGGGAMGVAHLGVLHDLENYNLIPGEIVGTSMGGIIGACMAIGMKENEIHRTLKRFAGVFNWVRFSFTGNAIVDNVKITKIFEEIFESRKMRDTQIPLKLIATDLLNGHKRVFIANDDVFIKDAILSTMAIPGLFEEHKIGDAVYGDGFLCENLGINETYFQDVLAIDVVGENSFEKEMPDNFFKTSNVLEMFEKSMRLLIYNQTRTHLKHTDKNVYLIEPNTKKYKSFQFHKIDEIRAAGLGLLQ